MAWNNPLNPDRLSPLLALVDLRPGDRVIDVGCGTGELLQQLVYSGVSGWGIDLDEAAISQAQMALPQMDFVCADVRGYALPTEVRLAVCLGSTHAFEGGDDAILTAARQLRAAVADDGYVLFGAGYQRQPLPPAYAQLLGEPSGISRSHADNVTALETSGLTCVAAITATTAEWDAFEWAFFRRRGKVAWRDAWLKWGRQTMGFGVYLLRPEQAASAD